MQLEAVNDNVSLENEQSENSESVDSLEPSETNDDNSNENNQSEPDGENGSNAEEQPKGKFSNLEEANKSYAELEKKLGMNSNELGELRKKAEEAEQLKEQLAAIQLQDAQSKGFETVESYKNHTEIAKFTANEYAKHLKECEFPDEMVNLLNEYRKNPTDEILETIESQFSVETLKNVAGNVAIMKGQLQAQEHEALQAQIEQSAKQYLDENVAKYLDDFKNPAFAALYSEAFRAYGCNLDTDRFVELMRSYATLITKQQGIKNGINQENTNATDEIAGLSAGGTTIRGNRKSLLQMSEKELDEALLKLI